MEPNTTLLSINASQPNDTEGPQEGYCSDAAEVLSQYTRVHMYLFLFLALLGITANVLNIAVFTRRSMLSPINLLLTALAASDLAFLVLVVPYALINLYWPGELNTYWWSVLDIFSTRTTTILQVYSLFLSMALAAWRYIAISRPLRWGTWCSQRNTYVVIVATWLVAVVGNVPYCLTRTVGPVEGGYAPVHREIAKAHDNLLIKVAFFMSTVLLRMLPLLVIAGLTVALIKELLAVTRVGPQTDQHTDRVTIMLSVVLAILLATVGPHALLNFLGGVYPGTFGTCRDYVGYITYLAVVLNASVNFIVYCLMSRQFRDALRQMFKKSYRNATNLIPLEQRRKNSTSDDSSDIQTNLTEGHSQPPAP